MPSKKHPITQSLGMLGKKKRHEPPPMKAAIAKRKELRGFFGSC
jgi:hypothetical protein